MISVAWNSSFRGMVMPRARAWSRRGANVLRRGLELIGKSFPLDDRTIEMAYRFWYLDNARARQELGLDPRPAEQTIRDTVGFLQRHKGQAAVAS